MSVSNHRPVSDSPLTPASLRSFESRGDEEQVCVSDGELWRLALRGEDTDGVLSLWIHLHPDRQTHLQTWR